MDGSWWSFDDTRVTKLSSTADVKTSSAYILFYHRRGSSNQTTQHWCRNLLKKHKLTVTKPESNGTDVQSPEESNNDKTITINGHDQSPTEGGSDGEKDVENGKNEACSSGTSEDNSALDSVEDNFTAPLARMEEVSMGLSPYMKEVQIESTV